MSEAKEPKPVSGFTEEQIEGFRREKLRIVQEYERKLQPFLGKPESEERKAIEKELGAELARLSEKYNKPQTINTLDKFGRWINEELATFAMIEIANGEFPFERAKESCLEAYGYAFKLFKKTPLPLPQLSDILSDPLTVLKLLKLRIDAEKKATEAGGDSKGRQRSKKKKTPSRKSYKKPPRIEHSRPLMWKRWADIFGISPNKLRELRENKTYHFRPVSARLWTLPICELPAEYLAKYQHAAPQTQP